MIVLITGATGLIGQEIVRLCHQQNIVVHYLTTSKSKLSQNENYKGFYWNPYNNEIDHDCFEGVSVIINLVGATIAKRWTSAYKKEILQSRTRTAQLLLDTITEHQYPVKHIVSASAIGVYPSSLTHYYDEDYDQVSDSFLGVVVEGWENAIDKFKAAHIAVSKIRIGLVLSENGGVLPKIMQPVDYYVGAAFGSGEQWQSWIHLNDLARLFLFVLEHELEGTFNAVAPNPVTNEELTKTVATILDKPLWLPNIPEPAMALVLGEMHILLFESQRVSADKIQSEGFDFKFPNLKPALQALINE